MLSFLHQNHYNYKPSLSFLFKFGKSHYSSSKFTSQQSEWDKVFFRRRGQGNLDKDPYGVSRIKNNPFMNKEQLLSAATSPYRNINRPYLSRSVEKRMLNGGKTADDRDMEKVKAALDPHLPIISESKGMSRIISLNRSESLNALNLEMIRMMTNYFQLYEKAPHVKSVILTSIKKGKTVAFCAGGDVVSLVKSKSAVNSTLRKDFFAEEYALNHLLATMKTPLIAVMDGITMGGGVGISVHASLKIATERTVFAMPETAIGFFPDVGGSFFLSRLAKGLGMYLALTGERLKGSDVYYAGIASHYVPSHRLPDLYERLSNIEDKSHKVFSDAIDEFSEAAGSSGSAGFSFGPILPAINECFVGDDLKAILFRVKEKLDSSKPEVAEWARKTMKQLENAAPMSLAVTHKMILKAKSMSFTDCLLMEYNASQHFMNDGNFDSGVTAKLIEKGKIAPSWNPPLLNNIQDREVSRYLEEMPFPLEKKSDFFISIPEEEYPSTKANTYGPYNLIFRNEKKVRQMESRVFMVEDKIPDFHDYPSNFGLPTESDLQSLISNVNFESVDHVVKFLLRDLSNKPGLAEHVRQILNLNTKSTDQGYLHWIQVRTL